MIYNYFLININRKIQNEFNSMLQNKPSELLLTSITKEKTKNDSNKIILPSLNQSSLLTPNKFQLLLFSPKVLNNSDSHLSKSVKRSQKVKFDSLSSSNLLNSYQKKNQEIINSIYKETKKEMNRIRIVKEQFFKQKKDKSQSKNKRGISAFSNISSIPHNKSDQSLISLGQNYRFPNFEVYPIELKRKLGFYPKIEIFHYSKFVVNSLEFQKNCILDQFSILFDNYFSFKNKFCNSNNGNIFINEIFPNIPVNPQKEINLIIEETSSLIMEVPFYLLCKFYNNIQDFISIPLPDLFIYSNHKIEDEKKWFQQNLNILYNVVNYLTMVKEAYLELLSEVREEIIIEYDNFNILKGYFERIRYNITSLDCIARNSMKDFEFDKKLINHYEEVVQKNKKDGEKISEQYKGHNLNNAANKIVSQLVIQEDRENLKKKRIKTLFEKGALKENKKKKSVQTNKQIGDVIQDSQKIKVTCRPQKSLINSKLVQSLFRYCNNDIKNQLMALKSHENKLFLN